MKDLVIFTHIFRTGGMAVYEYLKGVGVRVGRPTFEEITAVEYDWGKYDIIVVHAPYNIGHFIPNRRHHYVTFLREPHDRIVSRYFSSQDPDRTFEGMVAKFRAGKFEAPDNMMTRFTRTHTHSMKNGFWPTMEQELTWGDLEQAKRNLEENYLFVGLTSLWEESMQWLCRYFDWPMPDSRAEKDNRSLHRPDEELPGDVMEMIYRREVFDAQLYCFGRELAMDYVWR